MKININLEELYNENWSRSIRFLMHFKQLCKCCCKHDIKVFLPMNFHVLPEHQIVCVCAFLKINKLKNLFSDPYVLEISVLSENSFILCCSAC